MTPSLSTFLAADGQPQPRLAAAPLRSPCNPVQFWAISAPGPPYDVEAYIGEELLRPSKLTPGLDKA